MAGAKWQIQKAGFTLLEILVATGIIGAISILITQAFVATTRTNTKVEILKDVKQNGDFALGTMVRMIQNARSVTSNCSGSTSSNISITNPDGGATTFECKDDSSVRRIASTSASIVFLTGNNLTLGTACNTNALSFVCTTSTDGTTKSIKINFSLAQKGTPPDQYEQASMSFQTTVLVRN